MDRVEDVKDVVDVVRTSGHCCVTANRRRICHPLEEACQGGGRVKEVDDDTVEDPPEEVGEAGPEEAEVEEVTATESGGKDAEDVGEVEEKSVG